MVLGVGGLWVGLGCSQCVAERPWGAIAAALTAEGSPWSSVGIMEVGGHSVYCSPGMAPGLCCTPALGYPHVQRLSGCCGGPLEPSMGEKATRRWIVGVSLFSPFRGKSLLPTCSVKSRDEWELLEGPPCTPSADCLLHIPPSPFPCAVCAYDDYAKLQSRS